MYLIAKSKSAIAGSFYIIAAGKGEVIDVCIIPIGSCYPAKPK